MLYVDFMRSEMMNHPLGASFQGNVDGFIKAVLPSTGFSKWLKVLQGQLLIDVEAEMLADVYIKYGKRKPSDIPVIFQLLERQYDIDIEIPSQWHQVEYWVKHYEK